MPVVLAAFLASAAAAQPADQVDLEAGRAVVVGNIQAGSPQNACFLCHGLDGAGDSSGAFPRLSGLPAWYLYKQLKDYASKTRPNDIMSPVARALDDAQMRNVAAYYSARTAPYTPLPEVEPGVLQLGGAIAATGSAETGVQACGFCHGELGAGWPPSVPYLAGQYAEYMELQLLLWRDDVRNNDPLGVMEAVAKSLSREEIEAVSLYFESLRPSPDTSSGVGISGKSSEPGTGDLN
ncbi:MAG TPA: c-type cytochrome [Alphaproteobacteria bacterium]|nr:c-type cytochrome [Alphaproteobacteria bacterium]